MIHLGAHYWRRYFTNVFIPQINALQNSLDRVFASFDNLEEEANSIANEEYQRLCELPAGPDDFIDMSDLADMAQNKGIDYYATMNNMKLGLVGLFTSGLFHLFEQQIFLLYNGAMLKPNEEKAMISKGGWKRLKERFKELGIDIDSFGSYKEMKVLKLAANVIKHGEGRSAAELKKIKPDYFKLDKLFLLDTPSNVEIEAESPLAGDDVKIPINDFNQFCEDVKSFWRELGKKLI